MNSLDPHRVLLLLSAGIISCCLFIACASERDTRGTDETMQPSPISVSRKLAISETNRIPASGISINSVETLEVEPLALPGNGPYAVVSGYEQVRITFFHGRHIRIERIHVDDGMKIILLNATMLGEALGRPLPGSDPLWFANYELAGTDGGDFQPIGFLAFGVDLDGREVCVIDLRTNPTEERSHPLHAMPPYDDWIIFEVEEETEIKSVRWHGISVDLE